MDYENNVVKNGDKEVKVAARHVTDPIREDGLWKAFEFLGLL